MSDSIVLFLQEMNLSPEVIIFIVSMIPIVELRGGIVVAKLLGVPILKAYVICSVGNMAPIPFILIFIKEIFRLLKRFKWTGPIVNRLEMSALRKSDNVRKKQFLGLYTFVAIPLPGTGGWTGALIASLLGMPFRKAMLAVTGGVLSAGIIMLIISYFFIPGLFGF